MHVCREWIAAVDVAVRDGKQVKGTSCILLVGGGGLLVAGTPAETLAVLRRVEAKDGQV